ncbi:MAG: hypothetical protein H7329_00105 [Opitutaceae bacterium]|nr:hypothetical protein [Cytophagales bacterium]
MENLLFWTKWQKTHRVLYSGFLLLFLLSLLLFIFSEYFGKNIGLSWTVVPEFKTTTFLLDNFQKGFFQFSVSGDSQYIVQSYDGSINNSPEFYSYLIFGAILIVIVSGSVTISYTKGIWYFVALTILGIFFYLLNLDILEVFGLTKMYWTVTWFLIFGIIIHVFHAFKPFTPIIYRYGIFSLLAVIFGYLSLEFSHQINPLRHLVAYGWLAPFFISVLFIVIISTDILAGFLYLVTDSRQAKKSSSLINFLLISLFFLANVYLTFLKNRSSIDWNIFYLDAPVLLIVSAVIGIWSFKKKEPLYHFFADFSPATAIWFLVMATNCLLCYSFVNFSANDPLQEVFEDSVIFTQLTMGIMFIIFVVANFMSTMEQNLAAHLVVYKPRFMPFAFVRIIGFIGILSIILYNTNFQYRQAIAGQHIQKAEVFIAEDNNLLAEEYLTSALEYEVGNHKANYLLAMILRNKNKEDIVAKGLLKQAMSKNPSPQAYASLGISFLQEGDIIRSLEILREGKLRFPQSKEILNNLALAFSKTDIKDSTIFYLQTSRKVSDENNVSASNQLAFAIENNISIEMEDDPDKKDKTYNINYIALLNKINKPYKLPYDTLFLSDTALSPKNEAFAYNLALNNLNNSNSFKTRWFDSLIQKPGNNYYIEDLQFVKACRLYYSGNISEGIITLDQLQANSRNTIKYNNIIANWLMQQDAPRVATDFLSKASNAGDLNSGFGTAIATSFYLPAKSALNEWKNPVLFSDSMFKKIAISLHSNSNNVFTAGILPQVYTNNRTLYETFVSFPNDANKVKALSRTMQHLIDNGFAELSIKLYELNSHNPESDWQYLRALKKLNLKNQLSQKIKNTSLPSKSGYTKGWLLEDQNPKEATRLYKQALIANPLYEEGIVDAIGFLKTKQSDQETYEILLTSVMLNQYSIPIQKLYTLQCIQTNYFNFADYSLNKLKDLMSVNDYIKFEKDVEQKKAKRLSEIEWK